MHDIATLIVHLLRRRWQPHKLRLTETGAGDATNTRLHRAFSWMVCVEQMGEDVDYDVPLIAQRIAFNVVVELRPLGNPIDDDVDRILSYDKVTEAIAAELAEERLNLLETLAERVAERILHEPQAMRVFVRIEKLDRGPGASTLNW